MAIRCLTTQQPHPQPRICREVSQGVGLLAIYFVPLHLIVQLQLLVLGWYHPLLPPCNLYPSFPPAGKAGGLISPANLFSPPIKAPGHEDIPLPGDSVLRLLDTDPPWGSLWLCSSQAALSNVTPLGSPYVLAWIPQPWKGLLSVPPIPQRGGKLPTCSPRGFWPSTMQSPVTGSSPVEYHGGAARLKNAPLPPSWDHAGHFLCTGMPPSALAVTPKQMPERQELSGPSLAGSESFTLAKVLGAEQHSSLMVTPFLFPYAPGLQLLAEEAS